MSFSLRSPLASSSRLVLPRRVVHPVSVARRWLSTDDVLEQVEKLSPREAVERKKKAYEDKYGEQLRAKVQKEGVQDLEALKRKVLAPSVRAALKAKETRDAVSAEQAEPSEPDSAQSQAEVSKAAAAKRRAALDQAQTDQRSSDRAGVKPLGSILNLPLLHLTPHDAEAISKIWTTYHLTHASLASSFLSASLPPSTYAPMIALAQQNPFFVLPLPRESADGAVKTDEYDMFYLQWLFHPTPPPPPSSTDARASGEAVELPPTTSVIFTPLDEFKKNAEWAQPYLVLTHYPDLASSHDVVLMRGEITPASAGGAEGSSANPGWLLSQQQAQLLALALQRFYCADITPKSETSADSVGRAARKEALRGFREKPQEWDWTKLVTMAYGGLV